MLEYDKRDKEYEKQVALNIYKVFKQDLLPPNHIAFLEKHCSMLKPRIAYDIGAAVLHWQRHIKRLFPECVVICFDANDDLRFLYSKECVEHQIALLSDTDGLKYKYYYNRELFGGNSYYREIGFNDGKCFPEDRFLIKETKKLDTLVEENEYSYPDLIKIDCQGCELDIIKGAQQTLKYCKYLIIEMQEIDYNKNAPKADEVIAYLKSIGYVCIAPKFSNNGADFDSCFVNTKLISNII